MREKGCCICGVYRGNIIVCPRCNSWSCGFLPPLAPRFLLWYNFEWWAKYTKSNRLWVVEVYISLGLNSTLDNTWSLNYIIFLQVQVWIPPYFWDAPSNCISAPGNWALLWTSDYVTGYWNSSEFVSLPPLLLLTVFIVLGLAVVYGVNS